MRTEACLRSGGWRRTASIAALSLVALLVPRTAPAQCEGTPVGGVGVGLYHCVGGVCWISEEPGDRLLRFGTEPLLREVTDAGREAGLRERDVLVAVDGIPITVPEAGRRLANLEAGESVKLTVRRESRLREIRLAAFAGCSIGGLAVTGDTAFPTLGLGPDAPPPPGPRAYRPETAGRLEGIDPAATGSLGIGVSCGRCGWTRDGEGRLRWRAEEPLEVIYVDATGPGRDAGLEVGDVVTTVDGVRVDSLEGGDLLSSIVAGRRYELRVRRGAETRTVILEAGPQR